MKRVVEEKIPVTRMVRLSRIAEIFGVHHKTVYQWVRTGKLHATPSPGGMMLVRAEDVRAMCQRGGIAPPEDISSIVRRVVIFETDVQKARSVARTLRTKGFEVRAFDDFYKGFVDCVKEPPEFLVLDIGEKGQSFNSMSACKALWDSDLHKRTKVVAWTTVPEDEKEKLLKSGFKAVVDREDQPDLVRTIR